MRTQPSNNPVASDTNKNDSNVLGGRPGTSLHRVKRSAVNTTQIYGDRWANEVNITSLCITLTPFSSFYDSMHWRKSYQNMWVGVTSISDFGPTSGDLRLSRADYW